MRIGRLGVVALTVVSAALLGVLVLAVRERTKHRTVVLAAGSSTGESYALGRALKTIVEQRFPSITLNVQATGGTAENLRLLDHGQVALAAAQADVPVGPSARLVAVLYDDTFQLLVHRNAPIHTFADLRGKRVALAQSGGQFQSFLSVADHFGMTVSDCTFVADDDEAADRAFLADQADAVFRVRALGNPAIVNLVRTGTIRFVPIDQARAMQIKRPSFRPSIIPQGAYLGDPPIPMADLPSISVQRTLLARYDVSEEVVQAITAVLMESRQELAQAIPEEQAEVRALVASVRQPESLVGLSAPVHPGAQQYYDKDKPAFIEEYADFVALLLTVALLAGSWVWELRRWLMQRQKNRGDEYNHQVVGIITSAQRTRDPAEIEQLRRQLLQILTEVVYALDEDRISDESFQSFRVIWQIAVDLVRERREIAGASAGEPAGEFLAAVGG